MNPFALRGPDFLMFYLFLGVALIAAMIWIRRSRESGDEARIDTSDPYRIAYLRGQAPEALRVAVMNLIDRGLLRVTGDTDIEAVSDGRPGLVTDPLERALLKHFASSKPAAGIFRDEDLKAWAHHYRQPLQAAGLIPTPQEQSQRGKWSLLIAGVLIAIASAKIQIALAAGRRNIGFLIVLAGIFAILAFSLNFPRRTRRGDLALRDLQSLLGGLKARPFGHRESGSAGTVLLAAVFGVAALPLEAFPYRDRLFPQATSSANSSSGCGSSCGSSDSGGGGGCGGGGCGGCGGGD